MSKEVKWCKLVLETFIANACLSEEQEQCLRLHVAGWSRQKISDYMGQSISTTDRMIRELKDAYDVVQEYEPILPPRKKYHDQLKRK